MLVLYGFVTVDLQLMMGIMGDPSTQLEGLVHSRWCRMSIPVTRSCLLGSWSDRTSAEGIQATGFREKLPCFVLILIPVDDMLYIYIYIFFLILRFHRKISVCLCRSSF